MDLREQILGNCRWLFNQEVNIVSFWRSPESTGGRGEWHAIVVPRSCTLESPGSQNINDKILFRAASGIYNTTYNLDALVSLNYAIGTKISEILKEDSDGLLSIDEAEIPSGCAFQDKDAPIFSGPQPPASPVESLVGQSSSQSASPTESIFGGAFDPQAKFNFSLPSSTRSLSTRRGPGVSNTPTKSRLLSPPLTRPLRGGAFGTFNFAPGPDFGFPRSSSKAENTDSNHSPKTPDIAPPKDASATLDSAEKKTSAEQQPAIENHVEYTTSEDTTYEIIPTPGTSVVDDSDSDTLKLRLVDIEPYRQMVKDEIELAMDGLLGHLAETFREIRKKQQKTAMTWDGSSCVVDLNVDDLLGYLVESFEGMRGGPGSGSSG